MPQIKKLNLVIPDHYMFMVSCNFFIAVGIPDNSLENTGRAKYNLPPGTYKTFLVKSPSQIILLLHCKQINRVKNEVHGQPLSLLACMRDSDYEPAFTLIRLVFLELDTYN